MPWAIVRRECTGSGVLQRRYLRNVLQCRITKPEPHRDGLFVGAV